MRKYNPVGEEKSFLSKLLYIPDICRNVLNCVDSHLKCFFGVGIGIRVLLRKPAI